VHDHYPRGVPRAIIHLGTHKTGTTTFQRWADRNREALRDATGYRFYESMYPKGAPSAHFEFALATLRPDRMFQARLVEPTWSTPAFRARFEDHLQGQLEGGDIMISCEDLSLIRHVDEVERLHALLDGYDLTHVVVRREPASFLRSYRTWMDLHSLEPSQDPDSYLYVASDSWLLDRTVLATLLPGLHEVDYERAMDDDGSIIPALIEGMGLDRSRIPDWRVPALNSGNRLLRRWNNLRWRLRT
jgi:hypothetical protein